MPNIINKENMIHFPKFYIKAVGGSFTIMHRLTHSFIECVSTVDELKTALKRLNVLSEKELWEFLLYTRSATVVKPQDFSKRFSYEEDWYTGAWGIYTTQFFRANKKLLVEVEEVPYELVNNIRRTKLEKEHSEHKKLAEERMNASKILDEEMKSERSSKKVEEIKPLKVTDVEGIQKRIKKKKMKPKVRIKKKGNTFGVPVIGDNPFD